MIAVLDPSPYRLSRLYDRERPPFRLTRKTLLAIGLVAAVQFGIGYTIAHTYFEGPPQDKPVETNPTVAFIDRLIPPKKVVPAPAKTTAPVKAAAGPETHATTAPTAPIDDPLPITPVHNDGPVNSTADPFVPAVHDLAPTPPAPKDPPVIGNPNWLSKPTGDQVGKLYPTRALSSNVSGKATLLCDVLATGAVGGCSVVEETPKGYRFGEAALAMTRYFRLSPQTVDGVSVAGSKVRIPIVFNLG